MKKRILLIISLLLIFSPVYINALENLTENNEQEEISEPASADDYDIVEGKFYTDGGGTHKEYQLWILYSSLGAILIVMGIIGYKKITKNNKMED